MNSEDRKNFFKRLIRVVLIIVVFVIAVSLIYTYLHDLYVELTGLCPCGLPMSWILIVLTCLGVLVGMFTYYYLMGSFKEEKKDITEGIEKTLDFLDKDSRKIMKEIINQKGEIYQSNLVKKTDLDRVKTSRKLSELEEKGIITKEKSGVSNIVKLKEPYNSLYI